MSFSGGRSCRSLFGRHLETPPCRINAQGRHWRHKKEEEDVKDDRAVAKEMAKHSPTAVAETSMDNLSNKKNKHG